MSIKAKSHIESLMIKVHTQNAIDQLTILQNHLRECNLDSFWADDGVTLHLKLEDMKTELVKLRGPAHKNYKLGR